MAKIRIHLLGGFHLEHRGRTLPPIPSAIGRSLFAYLATYRDLRHTRDLLAGTFWPDQPEASARRRLSQALWQIQTALQEAGQTRILVESTTSDVAFTDDGAAFWLDVAEFDGHLRRARDLDDASESAEIAELEAAVALYRGEFMAGFYDDWTDVERERIRARYLGTLDRLTVLHKSGADYETALSFARRLTLHDPLREQAHREVMRICFLLGRSNEALRQYERCVAVLADELGTEPELETRELRTQIVQLRDKGEHAFAPTSRAPLLATDRAVPMVGRDDERAAVLRVFEETLLGRGGAVLIEGESGIGKTRLTQELLEDAQWRGLSPMRAECREDTQLHPFRTLQTALRSGVTRLRAQQLGALLDETTIGDLSGLVPEVADWLPDAPLSSVERNPEIATERLRVSLQQTLLGLAELSPHVLFIDDAQWADEESLGVIASLAGGLRSHGLMVCLSYRGAEARHRSGLWERLLDVDAAGRAMRIELAPLGSVESTQLMEESLGVTAVQRDVAEGLYHETGGNPLFILETLRAWHQAASETLTESPTPNELEFPVSGGVAQVIARRLADLSPPARSVLEATAVLGTVDAPAAVAAMAELELIEALRGLDELVRRNAVVESAAGYDFAHSQIRRVALDGMGTARLQALHAAAAAHIERDHPDRIEELAHHFTAADAKEKASLYRIASGRRAAALGAYHTAAEHFEIAALLDIDTDRRPLLEEWEAALDVLGRRAEQRTVLDALDHLVASPADAAELARRRSRLASHEGDYRTAVTLAHRSLDELGESADPVDRGRMLQNLGLVLSQSGLPLEAIPHLEAAVESFASDSRSQATVRCDLGSVLAEAQLYDKAAHHLVAALELYEQLADPHGMAEANGRLASVRMEQGRVEAAIELYRKALSYSTKAGYRRGEAVNLNNLGNALYHQGLIAEALDRYDQAAAVFASIGDPGGASLVRANTASVRHTILGDDTVETDVRAALEFFQGEGHLWGQAFCHEHLASIAHRRGDSATARSLVNEGLELVSTTGHRWVEVHLCRVGAVVELDDGRLAEARALVDRAVALCDESGMNDVLPTVESLGAMVALAAGDVTDALRRLRHAAATLESGSEQPYVVWHRLYVAAKRAGEEQEATAALATAVRLLDQVIEALPEPARERARTVVPEHRAILAAHALSFSQMTVVELPRSDVPLGRPLREGDWVEVRWTVTDPADFSITAAPERRRVQLGRLLDEAEEQGGAPRIEDLATALSISVATVRRDLATLRKSGHRVVTRGGR